MRRGGVGDGGVPPFGYRLLHGYAVHLEAEELTVLRLTVRVAAVDEGPVPRLPVRRPARGDGGLKVGDVPEGRKEKKTCFRNYVFWNGTCTGTSSANKKTVLYDRRAVRGGCIRIIGCLIG